MKYKNLFAAFAACLTLFACQEKEAEDNSIKSVSVVPSELTIAQGETQSLDVSVEPSSYSYTLVSWESADKSIATVSKKGTVSGIGEGTTTITATIDGVSGTCTVTVTKNEIPVKGISLNAESIEVGIGATEVLTYTIDPEDAGNKTVTWSSSDTAVATVEEGVVTGVAEGEAVVTVKTEDGGYEASCKVSVVTPGAEAIAFANASESSIIVDQGAEMTLTVEFVPATVTNKELEWKSSDESVATVTASGEAQAKVVFTSSKYGAVEITATAKAGGKTASQTFFVKGSETLYTLPEGKTAIDQRKTYKFNSDYYTTVDNVTWTVGEKSYEGTEVKFSVPAIGDNEVTVAAKFGDVTITDKFIVTAEEFLIFEKLSDLRWSKNTFPVFNKECTRAYVLTLGVRTLQEINLETGALGWTLNLSELDNTTWINDGKCISVNPITGVIYTGTYNTYVAVNPDGTVKWKTDTSGDYRIKGSGPAVNNDGSVVFFSRENNIDAVDAATGDILATYTAKGRAQLVVYGDNHVVMHTHNGGIRFVDYADGAFTEVANFESWGSGISDLAAGAVNKAQTRAYFCCNGDSGVTVAVDLQNRTVVDGFSLKNEHWSVAISESGQIYEAFKNGASTTSDIKIINPDDMSSFETVYSYENNADRFNHQGVSVDRDGNAYFFVHDTRGDGSYIFYKYVAATKETVELSRISKDVVDTDQSFQGCFNFGNGYLISVIGGKVASSTAAYSSGYLVVRCVDAERGHGWSGNGGDVCGSNNANFAWSE